MSIFQALDNASRLGLHDSLMHGMFSKSSVAFDHAVVLQPINTFHQLGFHFDLNASVEAPGLVTSRQRAIGPTSASFESLYFESNALGNLF